MVLSSLPQSSGVSAVLTKVTGPACRPEPPDEGVPDRLAVGWLAMLVALPIAHLATVSNDPGQAAGGALGGVAAGLAGRLAAPHVSPFRLMLVLVPVGVLGRVLVAPALIDGDAWRLGAGRGLLALAHGLGGWGGRLCLGDGLGPWLPQARLWWPKCCVRRGEQLEFSARLILSQAWSRYVRHRRRQWNRRCRRRRVRN